MKYIPKPEYHADLFSMIIKVSTDSMLKDYCTLHFSELLKKKKRKKITYHIYQLQRLIPYLVLLKNIRHSCRTYKSQGYHSGTQWTAMN